MLRNDTDNNLSYNGNNWAFNIRELLNQIGMTDIWLNQDTRVIDITCIKQRIHDNYKQSWYARINNSPKLCSHCCSALLAEQTGRTFDNIV